ncbi:uncharacterized protein LOC126898914 isoform X2 [Daktulosphaira vitifoliae]|uniref:uncharacterized protein LOC126898914 isoform X2 n=1 Tax=Daktulosphaira vitifoliae TaxID=58002 RepID=UPI0021AA1510|nr:uncharacterized protein LOC126898914 isoform X2 [Daktulosphaira vitifoliae]
MCDLRLPQPQPSSPSQQWRYALAPGSSTRNPGPRSTANISFSRFSFFIIHFSFFHILQMPPAAGPHQWRRPPYDMAGQPGRSRSRNSGGRTRTATAPAPDDHNCRDRDRDTGDGHDHDDDRGDCDSGDERDRGGHGGGRRPTPHRPRGARGAPPPPLAPPAVLVALLLLAAVLASLARAAHSARDVPVYRVRAVAGRPALLPCDVSAAAAEPADGDVGGGRVDGGAVPESGPGAGPGAVPEAETRLGPGDDDAALLVLWYRDDVGTPIYSVDARLAAVARREGEDQDDENIRREEDGGDGLGDDDGAKAAPLAGPRARRWSDPRALGDRASFVVRPGVTRDRRPGAGSALRVDPVIPGDGRRYRCRVDFGRAQTRNSLVVLTVSVPPKRLEVLLLSGGGGGVVGGGDVFVSAGGSRGARGGGDNATAAAVAVATGEDPVAAAAVGPYVEGDRPRMRCRATGGDPPPRVRWYRDGRPVLAAATEEDEEDRNQEDREDRDHHREDTRRRTGDGGGAVPQQQLTEEEAEAESEKETAAAAVVEADVELPPLDRSDLHAELVCRAHPGGGDINGVNGDGGGATGGGDPDGDGCGELTAVVHVDMNFAPLTVDVVVDGGRAVDNDDNGGDQVDEEEQGRRRQRPPLRTVAVTAGRRYEARCRSSGGRPPPRITWWLDGRRLDSGGDRETTLADGNTTTAALTLVPERPHSRGGGIGVGGGGIVVVGGAAAAAARGASGESQDSAAQAPPYDSVLTCRAENGGRASSGLGGASFVQSSVGLRIHYAPLCRPDGDGGGSSYGAAPGDTVRVPCRVDANPAPAEYRWSFAGGGPVGGGGSGAAASGEVHVAAAPGAEAAPRGGPGARGPADSRADRPEDSGAREAAMAATGPWLEYDVRHSAGAADYGIARCWARNAVGSNEAAPCEYRVRPAGPPDRPTDCYVVIGEDGDVGYDDGHSNGDGDRGETGDWRPPEQAAVSFRVRCTAGHDGGAPPQRFVAEVLALGERAGGGDDGYLSMANVTGVVVSSPRSVAVGRGEGAVGESGSHGGSRASDDSVGGLRAADHAIAPNRVVVFRVTAPAGRPLRVDVTAVNGRGRSEPAAVFVGPSGVGSGSGDRRGSPRDGHASTSSAAAAADDEGDDGRLRPAVERPDAGAVPGPGRGGTGGSGEFGGIGPALACAAAVAAAAICCALAAAACTSVARFRRGTTATADNTIVPSAVCVTGIASTTTAVHPPSPFDVRFVEATPPRPDVAFASPRSSSPVRHRLHQQQQHRYVQQQQQQQQLLYQQYHRRPHQHQQLQQQFHHQQQQLHHRQQRYRPPAAAMTLGRGTVLARPVYAACGGGTLPRTGSMATTATVDLWRTRSRGSVPAAAASSSSSSVAVAAVPAVAASAAIPATAPKSLLPPPPWSDDEPATGPGALGTFGTGDSKTGGSRTGAASTSADKRESAV